MKVAWRTWLNVVGVKEALGVGGVKMVVVRVVVRVRPPSGGSRLMVDEYYVLFGVRVEL